MSYTADILQSPDVKKMGSDVTYARRIHHNLDEEESNMNHARQIGDRIADKSSQPDERIVSEWMGPEVFQHWVELRSWIEASYPGLFAPDWIYGGKKRGWSLRYKKTKAFCTLLPAYRLLSVLVVLGRAEREKFEARRYS